jgi:hypothetical protein
MIISIVFSMKDCPALNILSLPAISLLLSYLFMFKEYIEFISYIKYLEYIWIFLGDFEIVFNDIFCMKMNIMRFYER